MMAIQISFFIGFYFDLNHNCFILVESILKSGGVTTSNRHLIILPSAR